MKTVFVGLSGGVDSSVAALLLKEQGYNVIGAYMKNWSQDLPGFSCPWFEDYQDAKRVAVQLGIKFELLDFEVNYKEMVVDYMINEYRLGRTPNPDILCNQEIKFKLFLESALNKGADLIATGHYAEAIDGKLFMASDKSKDQTYFLYRTERDALLKTIFPLGKLKKTEVRQLALNNNLITATKKESMGICFVGKVGIKEFLSQYVETEPGPIVDEKGNVLGEHNGAIFYTIGQRHGLEIGGGMPFYVCDKDMSTNTVYVTTNLNNRKFWSDQVRIVKAHWINEEPNSLDELTLRLRHRGQLLSVDNVSKDEAGRFTFTLKNQEKMTAPGQSAVIYRGEEVLGGGFIV